MDGISFDTSGNFLPARASQDDIDAAEFLAQRRLKAETATTKTQTEAERDAVDVLSLGFTGPDGDVPVQTPSSSLEAEMPPQQFLLEKVVSDAVCVTPDTDRTKGRRRLKSESLSQQETGGTRCCSLPALEEVVSHTVNSIDRAILPPSHDASVNAEVQEGLQVLSSIFLLSSNCLVVQKKYLPDSVVPQAGFSYDEQDTKKIDEQLRVLKREFNHLLRDFNGAPRADFLAVPKDVLELLRGVWNLSQDATKVDRVARRLVPVQSFFPNLLNYLLRTPGFPTVTDVFDSDIFRSCGKKRVKHAEIVLKQLIRTALEDMGYPCEGQEIDFYLSFMRTKLRTIVQDPHIDFRWESVDPWYVDESPAPRRKTKRGRKLEYKERVPFIAFFPLSSDGMAVEVWQAREDHGKGRDGVLVHIPFGSLMIARGDLVHAGGFSNDPGYGNPRCHLYIYRSGGEVHDINTSNTYTKEYNGQTVRMIQLYRHGPGI